jgi:ribosomal protein S3
MNLRSKWVAKNREEYCQYVDQDRRICEVINKNFRNEPVMRRVVIERCEGNCTVNLECLSLESRITATKNRLEARLQRVAPGCKLKLEPMSTPIRILKQIIKDCIELVYKNPKGNITNIIKGVLNRAMRNNRPFLRGAQIICNGRLRGANISGGTKYCIGQVPLSTLDACVVQEVYHMNLPFGVMSLKVRINVKVGGRRER